MSRICNQWRKDEVERQVGIRLYRMLKARLTHLDMIYKQ